MTRNMIPSRVMVRNEMVPHWIGRPIVREGAPGKRGHILILCPVGHLIAGIRREDWAGSMWEARVGYADTRCYVSDDEARSKRA